MCTVARKCPPCTELLASGTLLGIQVSANMLHASMSTFYINAPRLQLDDSALATVSTVTMYDIEHRSWSILSSSLCPSGNDRSVISLHFLGMCTFCLKILVLKIFQKSPMCFLMSFTYIHVHCMHLTTLLYSCPFNPLQAIWCFSTHSEWDYLVVRSRNHMHVYFRHYFLECVIEQTKVKFLYVTLTEWNQFFWDLSRNQVVPS